MAAQYHSLNAGDWKGVETLSRDLALVTGDVKVWAGNIGELKKIGTTSVPLQCWKVIYVKATGQWLAYLFNNDQSKPDGYNNNQVTKEFIEKLTGLKFAP
jgi:DNA/RNA endonuclease G (NUC1)